MRVFIAFEFDNHLKERISLIQDKLKKLSIKGRWTHTDNFHLTLKFLGDTTIEQCKKIEEQLSRTLSLANVVNLSLDELDFFSGDTDIRVLYVGLKGELKALQKLNSDIEGSMVKLGYEREKRNFNPHITLGRSVVLKDNFISVSKLLKEDCHFSFTLSKVSLMKSELSNGKRIYTPLKSYDLRKSL